MADKDMKADDEMAKARGTGFPAISLPEAAEIIKKAGAYGRQHSLSALATYAGHSTANSGPFRRKLAALKDWGLVAKAAGGVTITPTGMEIAHPTSTADVLDRQMDAFQKCSIFWKLYEDAAKGTPLNPDALGSAAINNYGVGVQSKDKFIKSFVDSALAVGLAERLPNGDITLAATGGNTTGLSTVIDAQPYANSQISENKPQASYDHNDTDMGLPPIVQQEWTNGSATIRFEIRSAKPLPAAAFAQIGEAVTGIETLWEAVGLYYEAEDIETAS